MTIEANQQKGTGNSKLAPAPSPTSQLPLATNRDDDIVAADDEEEEDEEEEEGDFFEEYQVT
jgi:hypothetical protein